MVLRKTHDSHAGLVEDQMVNFVKGTRGEVKLAHPILNAGDSGRNDGLAEIV